MILGARRRTIDVRVGLNDDNKPVFEGHTVWHGGRPFRARVRDECDRHCVTCDTAKSYQSGMFHVGVTEYGIGVRVWRRVDFVTFECVGCLHRRDPVTYPYESRKDAYGVS